MHYLKILERLMHLLCNEYASVLAAVGVDSLHMHEDSFCLEALSSDV